ncbi:uncharacterized protein LOC133903125 [Phragmites australis]|uniref:uncharacterized protein LOC133903125 n=1 Tax=Phragmites australis TaxID=29695 RepID=UPI002D793837|nr:uncharacterized protein LOC133903125 [Phragmites australis]
MGNDTRGSKSSCRRPPPTCRDALHDGGKSSQVSMAPSSGSEAPRANVRAVAITVEKSPAAARLSELGVKSWPTWGGPPGRYALSYGARQTCYIVRGRVSATPQRAIEFGAGDLVVFTRGTRCTWHIAADIDMHYAFDPS